MAIAERDLKQTDSNHTETPPIRSVLPEFFLPKPPVIFEEPISHVQTHEEANRDWLAIRRGRNILERQREIEGVRVQIREWDRVWAQNKHMYTWEEHKAKLRERQDLSLERKMLRRAQARYLKRIDK